MSSVIIDHADIVVTHNCNNRCPHCIDPLVHSDKRIVSIESVRKFLRLLKSKTDKKLTVLLLGGEPTTIPFESLVNICNTIRDYGFRVTMSTNGILDKKIIKLLPYFDSVQITVDGDEKINFWREYKDKINLKIAGDENLTVEKILYFSEFASDFYRRSISMYFTPDFQEICKDKKVWNLLNSLNWKRSGSYLYTFYKNIRIKRCIHGETNLIDEPTIPKLYPNGNYNKTWVNEEMDSYLGEMR